MKIGFIGCGNMGSAMIGGILRQGIFSKEDIIVSNLTPPREKHAVKKISALSPLWITRRSSDLQKLLFLP